MIIAKIAIGVLALGASGFAAWQGSTGNPGMYSYSALFGAYGLYMLLRGTRRI